MSCGPVSKFLLPVLLGLIILDAVAVEVEGTPSVAPAFALHGLDHKLYRMSDFTGRVVVVNFWASWCVPCREELPSMNRAAKILLQRPVTWLAVNVGEDRQAVTAFSSDYPIDFTVLLDLSGEVSRSWQVTGMPTTFVVDRQGRVVDKIVGKREWDDERHLQMLRRLADD